MKRALTDRPLWDRLPDRPVTAVEVAAVLPPVDGVTVYASFERAEYDPNETTFSRLLVEGGRFHYLMYPSSRHGWERITSAEHVSTETHTYREARAVARERTSWPDQHTGSSRGNDDLGMWDIAEVAGSYGRTVNRYGRAVVVERDQLREIREGLAAEVNA